MVPISVYYFLSTLAGAVILARPLLSELLDRSARFGYSILSKAP